MQIETLFLKVSNIHTIAVYCAGNKNGLPVIVLHGGPGSGADIKHFNNFDLNACFVILFDQRGCGESTPRNALIENTTWDLVADIEIIRQRFNLKKILLFGGSWGSTLALAYAELHPDSVLGLVLRSICLAAETDYKWLYEFGANQLFPLAWENFIYPKTKELCGNDLIHYYYQELISHQKEKVAAAALAWNNWAGACLGFPAMKTLPENEKEQDYFITLAMIEAHYFYHKAFLTENQLLNDLPKITHLKSMIIHGAKDYLCPVANAIKLHQAWAGSKLIMLAEAGHLSSDEGMAEALQTAVKAFY